MELLPFRQTGERKTCLLRREQFLFNQMIFSTPFLSIQVVVNQTGKTADMVIASGRVFGENTDDVRCPVCIDDGSVVLAGIGFSCFVSHRDAKGDSGGDFGAVVLLFKQVCHFGRSIFGNKSTPIDFFQKEAAVLSAGSIGTSFGIGDVGVASGRQGIILDSMGKGKLLNMAVDIALSQIVQDNGIKGIIVTVYDHIVELILQSGRHGKLSVMDFLISAGHGEKFDRAGSVEGSVIVDGIAVSDKIFDVYAPLASVDSVCGKIGRNFLV